MNRIADLLRQGHGEMMDSQQGKTVSQLAADQIEALEGERDDLKALLQKVRDSSHAWGMLGTETRAQISKALR